MTEGYAITRVRGWNGTRKYWAGFGESWHRRCKREWSDKPERAVLFVRRGDAYHVATKLNLGGTATMAVIRLSLPDDTRSGEGPDVGNRSHNPPQAVTAGETAPYSPDGAFEKVGGVASACSALAAGSEIPERRELDANASGSGVTAGETAPQFKRKAI